MIIYSKPVTNEPGVILPPLQARASLPFANHRPDGWRRLHHLPQSRVNHLFVTSIVAASNGAVVVSVAATLTLKLRISLWYTLFCRQFNG
ncbi:hypothetical protein L2E82_28316 [Cichorium intybus]|uniref:Uncharacterized protein n=1 Tax=Cichorium intybus TaxID=13427 RepID=A0ACB9CVF6_CICIN|nr:hypothetical protein L2E82_28316 [Cichorium intybus]